MGTQQTKRGRKPGRPRQQRCHPARRREEHRRRRTAGARRDLAREYFLPVFADPAPRAAAAKERTRSSCECFDRGGTAFVDVELRSVVFDVEGCAERHHDSLGANRHGRAELRRVASRRERIRSCGSPLFPTSLWSAVPWHRFVSGGGSKSGSKLPHSKNVRANSRAAIGSGMVGATGVELRSMLAP
jgi:hypothetical protein